MVRSAAEWQGHLREDVSAEVEVQLVAGQCARVFVAVSETILSIHGTVFDPDGVVMVHAKSLMPFAMMDADGAWCVQRTGAYRIRIEAGKGAGRAAVEVWTLPPA